VIEEDANSPKFPGCDNPFKHVRTHARRSIHGLYIP
jgi:hypothetical protein